MAILAYSKILNENEILSFVNRFIAIVSQKIFLSVDENLIDLGVMVYGILVGLGGVSIAQQIEDKVNYCINFLYKPDKVDKKYAMLSMLVQLLKNAQFITFNKIRKYSKYTELFRCIIAEKKQNLKKKGLELIDECIRETSKRGIQEQTNMLTRIYADTFKDKQAKSVDSEVNYGVVVVLKSLLTYANKEVLKDRFKEICDFLNTMRSCKTFPNQQIVMEMYPILSAYDPDSFLSNHYLGQAVSHLLKVLSNNQNMSIKRQSHESLSKILEPYHADKIEKLAKPILDQLFAEFKSIGKQSETQLLHCMVAVSEKVQRYFSKFFSEEQIHELVNLLLISGISEDVLAFLEFLLKINLPDLNIMIQIKLLYTISYILTNTFYNFVVGGKISEAYRQQAEDFKPVLDKNLRGVIKDASNEKLICVSLSCLSRFKFPDFTDQMVADPSLGLFRQRCRSRISGRCETCHQESCSQGGDFAQPQDLRVAFAWPEPQRKRLSAR